MCLNRVKKLNKINLLLLLAAIEKKHKNNSSYKLKKNTKVNFEKNLHDKALHFISFFKHENRL